MRKKLYPIAITIAGSDSGGGAGIEADLKTFAALGVHGVVAITSVTAQNTYQVTGIHDLPPEMVARQIVTVWEDMGIDAGKTGMLSNSEIIRVVAETVSKLGFPLVVDPVMIAKSGAPLLKPEAMSTLIKYMVPIATVITPNRYEAEKITGMKINNIEDARKAAKYIVEELGATAAIVKGGHIGVGDESIDIMYYNSKFYEFRAPRITGGCTHGTGCSFSAAIAAELAKGKDIVEAVKTAKKFITMAIKYGVKIGKGACPVNPMAWIEIPALKYHAVESVKEALQIIIENQKLFNKYIPETGSNLVMAIDPRYAETINDVAGVKGRIVRYGDRVKIVGPVEFGASSHMARLVLTAMKYDPSIRSAMNLKYDEKLVEKAVKKGYFVVYIDRRTEPEEVRRVEGRSIPWIMETAFKKKGRIPDIIYDTGDVGKEAMIRVLGRSPGEVVIKALSIIQE
ncbi:bifunctional hydroxymethylpyrimidine kinase/phosphomethylpyrimidine kinase [Staphylothermus hellenicus]|uniref:Phosphomethylpyrimidine kinase n=1 Tax=Staphylothermus hellenicus (strain DSM 12710 / JCM 10830 / BK20S6-10-b1 / P8) TaxID=591019 RepID=D7D7Y7_STAHD|nr:bifunctional hydroxymethylpyrimidine kinase/phosphomethylpyrimidine kinase [Staphylothermus hellenicus]ADI31883.1 phosphomethylpyrimidine kinase [Staphylothermus hellenicus DSM 12710]